MALCTQREKKRAPTATDGEKSGNRKAAVQSWSYVETFPPKIRPTRILPVVSPALVHFFSFPPPSPISLFPSFLGSWLEGRRYSKDSFGGFSKSRNRGIFQKIEGKKDLLEIFLLFLISLLRVYVVGITFEEKGGMENKS